MSRTSLSGQQTCDLGFTTATSSLTRLTFIGADGSETELVDQNTGGASMGATVCNASQPTSRGTVFVARDGSATTFLSSAPIYDGLQYAAFKARRRAP